MVTDVLPQIIWSTLPDGYQDYANAQWYAFAGVPVGSTVGDAWTGMLHPDDRERAWGVFRHSLASGAPYEVEYRLRRHDGVYRWTLGRALAVRNPDGTIERWIGTCTDIDERKKAEERAALVLREMNHRITNVFAVLGSLMGMEARQAGSAADLADAMQARLVALSAAHTLVTAGPSTDLLGSGPAGLFAMIRNIVAPYQNETGTRLQITGEDCPVDQRAATPVSLIFHELATNAVKYGALSVVGGTVEIAATHGGEVIALEWKESGGPTVENPIDQTGFGTKLADMMVKRHLEGSIERLWNEDGLVVRLTINIATLVAKIPVTLS